MLKKKVINPILPSHNYHLRTSNSVNKEENKKKEKIKNKDLNIKELVEYTRLFETKVRHHHMFRCMLLIRTNQSFLMILQGRQILILDWCFTDKLWQRPNRRVLRRFAEVRNGIPLGQGAGCLGLQVLRHSNSMQTCGEMVVRPPLHCLRDVDNHFHLRRRLHRSKHLGASMAAILKLQPADTISEQQGNDTQVKMGKYPTRQSGAHLLKGDGRIAIQTELACIARLAFVSEAPAWKLESLLDGSQD